MSPTFSSSATVSAPRYKISVVIGRFQPPHYAHIAMIEHALALAQSCVIVLGSAYRAPNSKNPFTHEERLEMLQACFSAEPWARIHCVALRDRYDLDLWAADVQVAVQNVAAQAQSGQQAAGQICLVGHRKDASSAYLLAFPEWPLEASPEVAALDASRVRAGLYAQDPARQHQALTSVPSVLHERLLAFANSRPGRTLAAEWQQLQAERLAWQTAPYPVIFVTLDALVYWRDWILLIQRGKAPGLGLWALPGGFLDPHETLMAGALRELQEETQLQISDAQAVLRGHRVFDAPERSLRGRVISHGYAFDLSDHPSWLNLSTPPQVCGSDDAATARWWHIADLPALERQMHDDHYVMVQTLLRTITTASTA